MYVRSRIYYFSKCCKCCRSYSTVGLSGKWLHCTIKYFMKEQHKCKDLSRVKRLQQFLVTLSANTGFFHSQGTSSVPVCTTDFELSVLTEKENLLWNPESWPLTRTKKKKSGFPVDNSLHANFYRSVRNFFY